MKEETKEKLQTLISQAIDQNITAGMNMLVRKDNEEIFYTEHGFRNLEEGKKIQRNFPSVFHVKTHYCGGGNDPDGAG